MRNNRQLQHPGRFTRFAFDDDDDFTPPTGDPRGRRQPEDEEPEVLVAADLEYAAPYVD